MRIDLTPPRPAVVDVVERALAEDLLPLGDLSAALLDHDLRVRGAIVAREPGVLAGRACVVETFTQTDNTCVLTWHRDDGTDLYPGDVVVEVEGPVPSIVTAERTALNLLCHLSGVATLTRRFVEAAALGGSAHVWDTRKTTPGLRAIEKTAVRAGGGVNHRGNLSEWVMLKDNHLALLGVAAGVTTARERWPGRTVHVECDVSTQVSEALDAGADAILLDNMSPDEVAACVRLVDDFETAGGHRPLVEASGGITLDTVGAYSAAGVDCISIGALTASAPALDLGLDLAV
jgi:nicotinate-nucleotide pyrophosphorylase (carboxylating)